MAKFEIKVVTTEIERTILTASVNNGNWKAHESWQDTTEETPLTINTLGDFVALHEPVKLVETAYKLVDGELIEDGKDCRLYGSLIDFLSIAIKWVKKSDNEKRAFNVVLCEFKGKYGGMTEDSVLEYGKEENARITIEKVD